MASRLLSPIAALSAMFNLDRGRTLSRTATALCSGLNYRWDGESACVRVFVLRSLSVTVAVGHKSPTFGVQQTPLLTTRHFTVLSDAFLELNGEQAVGGGH
jgi:hypothetical protein